MLKRIQLRSARITRTKLEAAPGAPIITWNTSSIEQVATKRMERVERTAWREVLLWWICVLLALFVMASVAFVLWWLGRYAML